MTDDQLTPEQIEAIEQRNQKRLDYLYETYGEDNVWIGSQEAQKYFTFRSFLAPIANVTRKSDGMDGTIHFDHDPRVYYNFQADRPV